MEKLLQVGDTRVQEDRLYPSVAFAGRGPGTERDARSTLPSDGGQMQGTIERIAPLQQEPLLEITNTQSSAFREACTKRNSAEKLALADQHEVKELFMQLSNTNAVHQKNSYLRKGVELLRPIIKGLNFTLNIANPLAIIEPTAVSGLAVVQIVAMVCHSHRWDIFNQACRFLHDMLLETNWS